ncbi:MAG: amidohydrolase [Deltaproteobacteria bacterium HGW-Deltaproteobacteria-21]|nr:MAG: amidohydrolase [Deltaproteobacteria bacterium HGW-Deltaproteobacteria-21]
MLKIDMFQHILPIKHKERLQKKVKDCFHMRIIEPHPALFDLETRFRVMDSHEGLRQVLTLAHPALEDVLGPSDAVTLAKSANDEMAELVLKYPDRFAAAVASLPLNDMDAALDEADRAIGDLNFKGVQIYTPANRKPLDSPEFMPLYEKMQEYDLPIWIHPQRDETQPDYEGERESLYGLFAIFGWPYETTLAMARLVISGVLEKFPNIKFITHHCGAMVPYFAQRFAWAGLSINTAPTGRAAPGTEAVSSEYTPPPVDYLRKFYADTVLQGNIAALMCGYDFFGPDHLVFATDYPFGGKRAVERLGREIEAIEKMEISPEDKDKIYRRNAERLLRISVS